MCVRNVYQVQFISQGRKQESGLGVDGAPRAADVSDTVRPSCAAAGWLGCSLGPHCLSTRQAVSATKAALSLLRVIPRELHSRAMDGTEEGCGCRTQEL